MKYQRIALVGGSGFVGRHLTHHFHNLGYPCRVITRHAHRHRDLKTSAQLVQADINDVKSLSRALQGCDVVVHLVGILNPVSKTQDFRAVHVRLTETVVEAAHRAGVRRLLHMSALQADQASGSSQYLRSKGEAENRAHTLGQPNIAVTSFRPSVIFGIDDSFINRFSSLLRIPGPLPLACPDARFAPVAIEDVCAAFASALENKQTHGKRFDLCGPEVFTLEQIVRRIAQAMGKRKHILRLPDWASRLEANLLQYAPGKPFTPDNYQSLRTASVCADDGLAMLGVTPSPLQDTLDRRFNPHNKTVFLDALRQRAGRN